MTLLLFTIYDCDTYIQFTYTVPGSHSLALTRSLSLARSHTYETSTAVAGAGASAAIAPYGSTSVRLPRKARGR